MSPLDIFVPRRDDEAFELAAVAAQAASEAGATPAQALEVALEVARATHGEPIARLQGLARRMRFAPDVSELMGRADATAEGVELLRLVTEAERNGDDLRGRLAVYLKNSFDRREMELRRRIEVVPVYMIMVLVIFFMPAILLVVIGPSFLTLLRTLYNV